MRNALIIMALLAFGCEADPASECETQCGDWHARCVEFAESFHDKSTGLSADEEAADIAVLLEACVAGLDSCSEDCGAEEPDGAAAFVDGCELAAETVIFGNWVCYWATDQEAPRL